MFESVVGKKTTLTVRESDKANIMLQCVATAFWSLHEDDSSELLGEEEIPELHSEREGKPDLMESSRLMGGLNVWNGKPAKASKKKKSVAAWLGSLSPPKMDLSELTAISPIDGRYRAKLAPLASFFSEYGLIRYRLRIEVEYLIFLISALNTHDSASFGNLAALDLAGLRSLYSEEKFTVTEADKIKNHEKVTNHDVKAVEYYLKDHITTLAETDKTWELVKEYIHFGLTSQDINNTAIPLLLKVRFHVSNSFSSCAL